MTCRSNTPFFRVFLPIFLAIVYLFLHVGVCRHEGDEGLLGHAADRVLAGDVPHKDFVDPYTGLLSLYHAFIFQIFGRDLINLRWSVFLASLPFTYCLYRLFSRFLRPQSASWATAGTLIATLPTHFSALPSWYLLFLSGTAFNFVVQWIDLHRPSLLVSAGLLIGLATAFKITGLLLLYSLTLSIIYATSTGLPTSFQKKSTTSHLFKTVLCLSIPAVGLIGISGLIWPRLSWSTFYLFIVPTVTVCIGPVIEWTRTGSPRIVPIIKNTAFVIIGFSLVWVPFLGYIALYGNLYSWWIDVFVATSSRLDYAAMTPPDLRLGISIIFTIFLVGRTISQRGLAIFVSISALIFTSVALIEPKGLWCGVVWQSLLVLTPLTILRATARAVNHSTPQRERVVLFASCCWAAFWNLNQYPYTNPTYQLYSIAPVLICWAAIAKDSIGGTPIIARTIWGSLVACSIIGHLSNFLYFLPLAHPGTSLLEPLAVNGASLLVSKEEGARYRWLVSAIQSHVPTGTIVAAPELSQVYYLTEKENPTPYLCEFFGDPGGGQANLQRYLTDDKTRAFITWTGTLEHAAGLGLKKFLQDKFSQQESAHDMVIWWR